MLYIYEINMQSYFVLFGLYYHIWCIDVIGLPIIFQDYRQVSNIRRTLVGN